MPTKTETNDPHSKVNDYISQLSEQEKLVLHIATTHLETSFDIKKSIGYIEWLQNSDH